MRVSHVMLVKIFFSITSVLVGLIIMLVAITGIIDPVGTKLADDNDPFGDPGGPWYPNFLIFVSLILILWPIILKIYRDVKDEKQGISTS
jgi:hypothetical protein